MPKILAIALCRVSTPEQKLNNSLSRQERNVLTEAEKLDAEIARWWSGDISSKAGTNVNRKDLKEMQEFCRQNKRVKYLIVDEPDRFMRSIDEAFYFEVLFRELGVTVWYASDPYLNTGDLNSKMLKFSKYFPAEGSNVERISKSINGHLHALKQGRWTFNPKPGYKRGYDRGVPEKRTPHAEILHDTFMKILSRAVTPTQALIEFNKTEFFAGGKAKYKMDKFRKIVTDPFYAGVVEMDKQVKYRNEHGLHEPLITMDQHFELVRIMNDKHKNQKGPRKNGNPKYPLSNIVTHQPCKEHRIGRMVGYDHGNGKNKALVYEKYRCRACGHYLTRQELHDQIQAAFTNTPISQEGRKDLIEALDKVWTLKEREAGQEANRINYRISILRKAIINHVEAATDPGNSGIKADILASISTKKAEVAALDEELESLSEKADADKERFLRFAFDFIDNMGGKFFEISKENRLRCKQLVFPGGFYLNADNKVYTPEVSILYRLASKKKDAEASKDSLLVRVGGL